MFNFNYFTSLASKGFKALNIIGYRSTAIKRIDFDVLNNNPTIVITDSSNNKHRFNLTNLGFFKDDGVTLVLESYPYLQNGRPTCDRWLLTR